MNWYACELHAHTYHSDGGMSPAELYSRAMKNQLDLIALTDHNTFAGASEQPFLPGMEWTTYHGHMVVLGASRFVDWRDAGMGPIDGKLKAIHDAGGAVTVAHPCALGSPVSTGSRWEMKVDNWDMIDAWEVWHSNRAPLTLEDEKSLREWTRLLDAGNHIAAVYGRDWHRPDEHVMAAVTYLGMPGALDNASAVAAIRAGRTLVTMGPVPVVTVTQGDKVYAPGDTLDAGDLTVRVAVDMQRRRAIWEGWGVKADSVRLIATGGREVCVASLAEAAAGLRVRAEKGWLRAEVVGSLDGEACCVALVSAFYVR